MTRDGGPPQYIGSGFFATPEIFITETVATDTIGVIFIRMIEGACYGSEVFSCSPASAPHYIQGVCNGEGATPEISSAIFGLNWLFLGGPTPPCRKACDSDGNGDVNITDMVHLLNFLFLGGFPPSLWGGPNPICSTVAPGDDCEIPNSACPLP